MDNIWLIAFRDILPKYLEVILSLPAVTLTLGLFVLISFNKEIRNFINRISRMKFKDFEFSQEQSESSTNELPEHKFQSTIPTDDKDATIAALTARAEAYEFAFLERFLVPNSRLALTWFLNTGGSTKDYWKSNFFLPPEISNPEGEKEAILNVLITTGLIEPVDSNNLQFRVSEKGRKFMQFAKLDQAQS